MCDRAHDEARKLGRPAQQREHLEDLGLVARRVEARIDPLIAAEVQHDQPKLALRHLPSDMCRVSVTPAPRPQPHHAERVEDHAGP